MRALFLEGEQKGASKATSERREESVCFVVLNPCSGGEVQMHRIALCETAERLKTSECAVS